MSSAPQNDSFLQATAKNRQFRPGELWFDTNGISINAHGGGILFHKGTHYWFGEHKVEGEAGNRAQVGVHVYSSKDLYQWTDAGIALTVSDDPACEISRGCILERPKVIHNRSTGKFVMWFHLEPKGMGYDGARSGIAIADAPTGPYRYCGSQRANAGIWPMNAQAEDRLLLDSARLAEIEELGLGGAPVPWYPKHAVFRRDYIGGQMARDMTLFVDDDGTAYHLYASENNGTLHISQLSDDYLHHSGHFIRIFPGRFHEAPAMMKWRGRYFLFSSDCTGWAPNSARLSVADSILGPWEELGNPCLGTGAQITNTFESQPTFILPVVGRNDAYIFMADRWRPQNAIDGRYVWLPIEFRHGVPTISWHDSWTLNHFDR